MILPRQARGKHRENSKKDAVFRTGEVRKRDCRVVIVGKDEPSASLLRVGDEYIVRREFHARQRPVLCTRDDVNLLRLCQ